MWSAKRACLARSCRAHLVLRMRNGLQGPPEYLMIIYERSYYSEAFVEPLLDILGIPRAPFSIPDTHFIVHFQIEPSLPLRQ